VSEREFCATFQPTVELIGRRWCGAIARALLDRSRYFAELERAIPAISGRGAGAHAGVRVPG
jgi:DNA-binding HxlR family transcriptional regulator